MTKMVPTDDGGHIQRYTEISWKFSAKPRRRHSRRIGQLSMKLIGARLQFAIWADLQLLVVGWSDIHAIAWIKITCSQGRIMDMDLELMIPCHRDRSMSGYFLMMNNMSPNGLWDCDEESMEGRHYGG
jgi:hypothetical protein